MNTVKCQLAKINHVLNIADCFVTDTVLLHLLFTIAAIGRLQELHCFRNQLKIKQLNWKT